MNIFYTSHCPDCFKAKDKLEEAGIEYEEVDITTHEGYESFKKNFRESYPNSKLEMPILHGDMPWVGYYEIELGIKEGEI
ncbi:hypothetical protein EOL73_00195 [Candidatus Saccharibacteria bacterium]|nr:hypothetical protein [Candidatus Saccharibacteria bacterium]